MNVVYRFRIYPNKIQQELFAKTFGCVRFVYNRMLAEKKECYEKTGKNLKVAPAKYKAEFPWPLFYGIVMRITDDVQKICLYSFSNVDFLVIHQRSSCIKNNHFRFC